MRGKKSENRADKGTRGEKEGEMQKQQELIKQEEPVWFSAVAPEQTGEIQLCSDVWSNKRQNSHVEGEAYKHCQGGALCSTSAAAALVFRGYRSPAHTRSPLLPWQHIFCMEIASLAVLTKEQGRFYTCPDWSSEIWSLDWVCVVLHVLPLNWLCDRQLQS